MTGRRGRRRKQLLDEVKEKRRYWEFQKGSIRLYFVENSFGKVCGSVVREAAGKMVASITTELHSE
jgi:hypothetical protein